MSPEEKSDLAAIDSFRGPFEFLSNFYRCIVPIAPRDLLLDPTQPGDIDIYPTAEHAFQAGKSFDPSAREKIRNANIPSRAKGLGRRVKRRPDWEAVKEIVMLAVLRAKFSDPKLAAMLLATGDRPLIEGNTWGDREWGMVAWIGENQTVTWIGENKLGRALTKLRAEMRAEPEWRF